MAQLVQKAWFFRHGTTGKAPQGSGHEGDKLRELTEVGQAEARTRRRLLGSPRFNRAASSPMLRARQTASIIGDVGMEALTILPGFGVDDPALGGFAQDIDELFNGLAYTPLRAYREANAPAMDWYGKRAWEELQGFLRAGTSDERVLVAAHAVLLPAALYPAVQDRPEMAEKLLDLNLNPAGGFGIMFHDGIATELIVENDPLV